MVVHVQSGAAAGLTINHCTISISTGQLATPQTDPTTSMTKLLQLTKPLITLRYEAQVLLFLHKSILPSAANQATYDLGIRFLLRQVLDVRAATARTF